MLLAFLVALVNMPINWVNLNVCHVLLVRCIFIIHLLEIVSTEYFRFSNKFQWTKGMYTMSKGEVQWCTWFVNRRGESKLREIKERERKMINFKNDVLGQVECEVCPVKKYASKIGSKKCLTCIGSYGVGAVDCKTNGWIIAGCVGVIIIIIIIGIVSWFKRGSILAYWYVFIFLVCLLFLFNNH